MAESGAQLQRVPDRAAGPAMSTRRAAQFDQCSAALRALTDNALLDACDQTCFVAAQHPWATDDLAMVSMPTQRTHPWPQTAQDRR